MRIALAPVSLDVPTDAHRHAADSWAATIAWELEAMAGRPVEVRLRDGRHGLATVCTDRRDGWPQLERDGDRLHLEPFGWVSPADVVAFTTPAA